MTAALVLTLTFTTTPGLLQFAMRVHDYVETHRRLAAAIEQPLCSDAEELTRQADTLATAIRDARPRAKEGDIFTFSAGEAFGALPWRTHVPLMPIIRELPELPPELEYRFIGRDLVLMDVGANMVVDVLRDALPRAVEAPAPVSSYTPCAPHPELDACWM
jgi:hypothetical protein